MAVPKKKKSKARTGAHQHAAWRLNAANVSSCPRCNQPKLSHRVCNTCGWYGGRIAVEVD